MGRTEIVEDVFSTPRTFLPIDAAAKDGEVRLVKAGDDYAAAQWTGDMWSEPFDASKGGFAVQIDFEPTHYDATPRAVDGDAS